MEGNQGTCLEAEGSLSPFLPFEKRKGKRVDDRCGEPCWLVELINMPETKYF